MALSFVTSLRNAQAEAFGAHIDAGTGPGTLQIYDGARPATNESPTTQVLLAELTFAAPSFPAASAGAVTANAILDDASADAPGTASWFQVVDGDGTFVSSGDIGLTGSGADLTLNAVEIAVGVTVNVSEFSLTTGNA